MFARQSLTVARQAAVRRAAPRNARAFHVDSQFLSLGDQFHMRCRGCRLTHLYPLADVMNNTTPFGQSTPSARPPAGATRGIYRGSND